MVSRRSGFLAASDFENCKPLERRFSPVPTDIDMAKLRQDIDDFKLRNRLRRSFKHRTNDGTEINKFKVKSSWNPPKDDPLLESYLSLVEKSVLSVSAEGKSYPNLSHSELSALKCVKSDFGLVSKEADKGSAVVAWDRGDYVTAAVRQLDDRQGYEEVEVDPTVELGKTILSLSPFKCPVLPERYRPWFSIILYLLLF